VPQCPIAGDATGQYYERSWVSRV